MEPYTPTIIKGEQRQDDEILAKTPLDATALGGDNSVIIMELLQRFKVRDVMKRTVISIARDTSMREAQRIMRENRISGVPVSEDGRLFGIVSVNDIINALDNGWIECPQMTHAQIIRMMEIMDGFRRQWGMVYPDEVEA